MPEVEPSIVAEYDIPHPPERVWHALTDAQTLSAWLMPNDIEPTLGHRFTFHGQATDEWDGAVQCQILTLEPNRVLAYSWCGGSDAVESFGHRLDTVVTWTLTPTPSGGTLLRLDHEGFTAADEFAYHALRDGWHGDAAAGLARVLAV